MGRKNRNKIKKESDPIKEQQKQDEYNELLFATEQDQECVSRQAKENHFKMIWDTRRAMLEYCDETAIPLCDYMTIDIFQDFVKFLIN